MGNNVVDGRDQDLSFPIFDGVNIMAACSEDVLDLPEKLTGIQIDAETNQFVPEILIASPVESVFADKKRGVSIRLCSF